VGVSFGQLKQWGTIGEGSILKYTGLDVTWDLKGPVLVNEGRVEDVLYFVFRAIGQEGNVSGEEVAVGMSEEYHNGGFWCV